MSKETLTREQNEVMTAWISLERERSLAMVKAAVAATVHQLCGYAKLREGVAVDMSPPAMKRALSIVDVQVAFGAGPTGADGAFTFHAKRRGVKL